MTENNVIFDFDLTIGRLVTDWAEWRKAVWELVKTFDSSSTYGLEQITHASQNDLILKYGPVFKKDLDEVNEKLESSSIDSFVPNDKVVAFIQSTDKNLYLWPSNSHPTVSKYLKPLGIEKKFQAIVTREQVSLLKPDPEGFSLIHNSINALHDYVLVGDSQSDATAALNAGMRFVHVDSF
ncbi:MAG: hypothetical protein QOE22_60 [Candidatus Parcubacteria bacterium]|jgi:HAD superfamily hydrolase (TIGR01549 family)|nr:hypothetical protein [Candidatus Parcubacteria bacterium]